LLTCKAYGVWGVFESKYPEKRLVRRGWSNWGYCENAETRSFYTTVFTKLLGYLDSWKTQEMHTQFWSEDLKNRSISRILSVYISIILKQTWWVNYFPYEKFSNSEGGLWSMEFFNYVCWFVFKLLIYEFGQELRYVGIKLKLDFSLMF